MKRMMAKDESWYFVFRKYPAEHVDWVEFGWTPSKSMMKAFMMQRDKEKYRVFRANEYKLARDFGENQRDYADELKLIRVKSVRGRDEYAIITTENELIEAKAHLLDDLRDLAALSRTNDEFDPMLLGAFLCLYEQYHDALEYLGFHPKEVDATYQADYSSIYSEQEMRKYYGSGGLVDVPDYEKCLYSLEGLIAGLKEDF